MVRLLSAFGRTGFLTSVVLMYLSILTTLTAVLVALGECFPKSEFRLLACFGIPLLVSRMGFAGIVDHVYALAGLVCLVLLFLPLFKHRGSLTL